MQKEDFSERESASFISLPLVRHLVTILLGPERALDVKLVSRRYRSPLRELLFQDDVQPSIGLPTLQSLDSFTIQQRQELLFSATGLQMDLSALPEEWRLFFLAITYWATRPNFPITDRMVHAVVLGLVLQAVVHPVKKGNEKAVQTLVQSANGTVKQKLANINSAECRHVYGEVYAQNSFTKSTNKKGGYDLGVVHALAQLQSVVLALHQLNQLFLIPFAATPMHKLYSGELSQAKKFYFWVKRVAFSGTLMYNVANSLQSRQDPEAYVRTCLAKSHSVFSVYLDLVNIVMKMAPDTKKMISKKKRHRAKKAEVIADLPIDCDMVDDVESDGENGDSEWGENNRFALLKVK